MFRFSSSAWGAPGMLEIVWGFLKGHSGSEWKTVGTKE